VVGRSKSNSLVVMVEVRVVSSHEDVSNDEVGEVSGELGAHDSGHALSVSEEGDFNDVVSWGEVVLDSIEEEINVWKAINVAAILINCSDLNKKRVDHIK
jgi:hypothetical protein